MRLVPHMNAAAATSFHSCSCFPASSGVLPLCLLALSVGVVMLEHDAPLTVTEVLVGYAFWIAYFAIVIIIVVIAVAVSD